MDQILKGPNANIITKSIQTTIFLKNNCKCKNPSEVLDYQHIAIISIIIHISIVFDFCRFCRGFDQTPHSSRRNGRRRCPSRVSPFTFWRSSHLYFFLFCDITNPRKFFVQLSGVMSCSRIRPTMKMIYQKSRLSRKNM